jgi:trk system potassium uptake protein TrkA
MNIVILGAGSKGAYLAKILAQEEHNVFVVDKDPLALKKLAEEADVATIYGEATNWKIFEDLIENEPSLFIAITGDDATNLVACSMAKNLGYPQTIARVKEIGFLSRSRLDFGRLFFVDYFLGAEVLTAHNILKNIMNPEDLAIENFAHGAIQMRTIILPEGWKNTDVPLSQLDLPKELIISLIRRKSISGKDDIIFPTGNDFLLPFDEITVVGETKIMYELHTIFNCTERAIKTVVIVGGSSIALSLASVLERLKIKAKIIEKDERRCEELAEALSATTIINQDGTNVDFLQNEQIKKADIFIACTRDDKTNLLISLLGKQVGAKKTLTLISDIALSPLLRDLNVNFILSERVNIANKVLSIIHAEKIISIASLCENQAKVLEIKVSSDSHFVGIPLSDLRGQLPKKLIVAAIENKGKVMIGKGNRVISPNDTIIIICSPEHMHELHELF